MPILMAYEKLSERDREVVAQYKSGIALGVIADQFEMRCADVQRLVLSVTGNLERDS